MTETLIKLRRSAVPGKTPTDSQLELGEVAINTYDGKMFYKQASTSNTILQVATTSLDLSQFATTTSAQLASVISNETGTGSLVFGTSPALVTPVINGNTTFDSGTLFIDSVNNRVGVNTISPTQALHVVGNARITGGIADSNGNFGTPGQVLTSNTSGIYWVTSTASGTNLSTTYANDTVTVNSSTGTNAIIVAANGINAGVMSAPDKVKLDRIEAGAQVNVPTNLSIGSSTGTVVRVDSSTGANATLPVASAALAGVVTNAAQTFAGVKSFTSNTIFDTDTLFVDSVNNRVGIGTAAPVYKFDLSAGTLGTSNNDSVQVTRFSLLSSNYDSLTHRAIRKANGTDWTTAVHRIERVVDVTPMGYMQFGDFNATGDLITFGEGSTEYVRINGSGNVGIGIAAPTERLHVEGNTRSLSFAAANGSASAPAFDFAADPNTGVFLASADTIGFATNGTTAAQLTSTGNLRLFNTAGTRYTEISTQPVANNTLTLPTSGNITLVSGTMVPTTGTGATGTWAISITGNADTVTNGVYTTGDQTIAGVKAFTSNTIFDTNTLFVDAVNNRVGIGTITPETKIHTISNILGTTADNEQTTAIFTTPGSAGGNYLNLRVKSIRHTTGAIGWENTETRLQYDVDGNASKNMWISFYNDSGAILDNIMRFGESANTEWMRIDNGLVGIGTASPTEKLHVEGNARALTFAAANGSVSAPAFDFAADTNTGMFLAGADTIGFATNGTTAAQFTSTGNLRLFNTAGTRYTEISTQPISNNSLVMPDVGSVFLTTGTMATTDTAQTISGIKSFTSNTIFDTDTLFVNAVNNRVGIGTATPITTLHVNGELTLGPVAPDGGQIQFHDAGGNNSWVYDIDSAGTGRIYNIANGNSSFVIGQLTTGSGVIRLRTNNADRLTVAANGNIGIGTSTPKEKLSVTGNVVATGSIDAGVQFLGQAADTNTAPSFSWTGDTNTGIFRPVEDAIGFSIGGSEIARLSTNGLTIGAAANSSFGLFIVNDDSFTIGTVTASDSADPAIRMNRYRGTLTAPTPITTNTVMGGLRFFGSQNTSPTQTMTLSAAIDAYAAENFSETTRASYISFRTTNPNSLTISEKMRITANGNVGIGTTTPSTLLQVNGEVTAVDYNTTSDINVKKNIEPIDNAIFKISQINGVTFSFIDDPDEQRHAGVIAQDVEKVLPEAVKELGSGVKHVAYGNLIGLLVEAIKDQQKQIDELKALINK